MPRVSQAHRESRRRQILDAARRCFVRNGFHATSMQDVLREADLSAGAVYGYFDGKAAIVGAIVDEALAEIEDAFRPLDGLAEPPPLHEAVAVVLTTLERLDEQHGIARIAVQVWGEAVREPAYAARVAEVFERVHGRLAAVVEAHQERGTFPGDVPAGDVARVLASVAPGFVLQRAILTGAGATAFAAALRALASPPPAPARAGSGA